MKQCVHAGTHARTHSKTNVVANSCHSLNNRNVQSDFDETAKESVADVCTQSAWVAYDDDRMLDAFGLLNFWDDAGIIVVLFLGLWSTLRCTLRLNYIVFTMPKNRNLQRRAESEKKRKRLSQLVRGVTSQIDCQIETEALISTNCKNNTNTISQWTFAIRVCDNLRAQF